MFNEKHRVYIDNIYILNYSYGEAFINANDTIVDYYTITDNDMPVFVVNTENKYGMTSDSVWYSLDSSCDAITSHEMLLSDDQCNPLFFEIAASDTESDDISIALDCGQSGGLVDYYAMDDDFTDALTDILTRYDADGCNFSKSSFDAYTQALRFDTYANCSILTSHFSESYPTEQNYLYPNFFYFMDMRFNLKGDNRQVFQFNALDGNVPIVLGFRFNHTTNVTEIYHGNSCCVTSPTKIYELHNLNNLTSIVLRLMLNKDSNEYMYSLTQGSEVFYSAPVAFVWGSPLVSMQVYADSIAASFTPVNAGQLFGNFSLYSLDDLPIFSAYTTDALNCTKGIPASWTSRIYATDSVHGDNYLNYEEVEWYTGFRSASVPAPTDIETDNLYDSLFGDSEFFRYLFGLIMVLVLIGATAVGLAKAGVNGGALAGITLFTGVMVTFVMAWIGIFPIWIPIGMLIIAGLIITFFILKPFSPGGV